jgi:hypothetical protein
MNLVALWLSETASLAARFSSAFNNVLVTFYILWFIQLFSPTLIAPMLFDDFSLDRATDRRRGLA